MTPSELLAIEERAEKATPGPWRGEQAFRAYSLRAPGEVVAKMWRATDLDFIAHAREDVPKLLAHVRAQAERVRTLEGVLAKIARWEMQRDGSNYERWQAMHMAQAALGWPASNELHQYGCRTCGKAQCVCSSTGPKEGGEGNG